MSPNIRRLTVALAVVLCTGVATASATPLVFSAKNDTVPEGDIDVSTGVAGREPGATLQRNDRTPNTWTTATGWSGTEGDEGDEAPVPLPGTIWLLATGLAAVGGARLLRRR